jgi:antitoxin VapB
MNKTSSIDEALSGLNPRFEGKAKLFMKGRSKAVKLPASCRFEGDELYILRVGDCFLLSPRPTSWDDFFDPKERMSEGFDVGGSELAAQEREPLK